MNDSKRQTSTSQRLAALSVLLTTLLVAGGWGCDKSESRPAGWTDVSTTDQPEVFTRRQDRPALASLDGFYLGQPRDEAKELLSSLCSTVIRRKEAGFFGGDAYFLGCRIEDHPTLTFVRLGFWPEIDERVATLEIKRSNIPPSVVYERALAPLDEKPTETLHTSLITLVTPSHRVYADWEKGPDGPVHIIVGLNNDE